MKDIINNTHCDRGGLAASRIAIIGVDLAKAAFGSNSHNSLLDLACILADMGNSVDVVDFSWSQRPICEMTVWRRYLRDNHIRLVRPNRIDIRASNTPHGNIANLPFKVYEFIKDSDYDVIHAPDSGGMLYYTLLGKKLGLLKKAPVIWSHVFSPMLYQLDMGETIMTSYADPLICYMERRVTELSDYIGVNSSHILEWMHENSYNVNEKNIIDLSKSYSPLFSTRVLNNKASDKHLDIGRLAFVGKLNQVRGLPTFCYMVQELHKRDTAPDEVVFLGSEDNEFDSRAFIGEYSRTWTCAMSYCPDLPREQFISELLEPGTLAVMPALRGPLSRVAQELILMGLPFVSTDTGGIPAYINNNDREAYFVKPHYLDLTDKVIDFMHKGAPGPISNVNSVSKIRNITQYDLRKKRSTESDLQVSVNHTSPLVTVCMAHHNRPDTLELSLNSILKQDYTNIEIVIVDDGSDRDKLEQLKRFKSNNNKITIISQNNRYLGAARNTGARHASGKYLLFMDDDNIAKSHEIGTFVNIAENHSIDILVCFSDNFRGDGLPDNNTLNGIRRMPIGQDIVYGLYRNGYGDSNCFMRREVWDRLGGFTEHYRVGLDDHEFFTRATFHGFRIEVVPESLYYYRLNDTKMRRFHLGDRANFNRIIEPYLSNHILPAEMKPLLYSARAFYEQYNSKTDSVSGVSFTQ